MTATKYTKAARPSGQPAFIVCTDLDGTLLDHHTYEWSPAQDALDRLAKRNIPVVINTSKTFEEVRQLQQQLNLQAPFIVENGSAIYLPRSTYAKPEDAQPYADNHWQMQLGDSRANLITLLKSLRNQMLYKFESFFDMSLARVIELTGLPTEAAEQAMNRQFSEPLIWRDSDEKLQSFTSQIAAEGKQLLVGGRFIHVLGNTDKAKAILWFCQYIESLNHKPVKIIALGDSGNDIAMLNIADYAVTVRSPVHDYPNVHPAGQLLKTTAYGPAGWAEAINQIIT